jgi:hypothetical protein
MATRVSPLTGHNLTRANSYTQLMVTPLKKTSRSHQFAVKPGAHQFP